MGWGEVSVQGWCEGREKRERREFTCVGTVRPAQARLVKGLPSLLLMTHALPS